MAAATSGMLSGMSRVRPGAGVGLVRQHRRIGGHEQHVVEGEGFGDGGAAGLAAGPAASGRDSGAMGNLPRSGAKRCLGGAP
jgi:hypothetical protein